MRAIKEANTGESGCMEEATLLAELHNTALTKALQGLEGRLEGFKYSNFDAHKAGAERINNPLKHGMMIYLLVVIIIWGYRPERKLI